MTATEPVVLSETKDRIATITLNRPAKRNALDTEVLTLLPRLLVEADEDPDVDVMILTGTDPAFCAGLDLGQLGDSGDNLRGTGADGTANASGVRGPFPARTKPLIGAINGVAVTGGFELALNCDFLVASERAKFGDTHARVGVMPGWGLAALLPSAIGIRRAREMSLTGNFLDATEARSLGLVNHVVAHEDLIPFTRALAADIIGNDRDGVRQMLATYARIDADPDAWETESRAAAQWRRTRFTTESVAARRDSVMERGRRQ